MAFLGWNVVICVCNGWPRWSKRGELGGGGGVNSQIVILFMENGAVAGIIVWQDGRMLICFVYSRVFVLAYRFSDSESLRSRHLGVPSSSRTTAL